MPCWKVAQAVFGLGHQVWPEYTSTHKSECLGRHRLVFSVVGFVDFESKDSLRLVPGTHHIGRVLCLWKYRELSEATECMYNQGLSLMLSLTLFVLPVYIS